MAEREFGIPLRKVTFLTGFPPKELELPPSSDSPTLELLGLRSGQTLLVREDESGDSSVKETKQGSGWDYIKKISKSGMMKAHKSPADNSCLFHSVAYVCTSPGAKLPFVAVAFHSTCNIVGFSSFLVSSLLTVFKGAYCKRGRSGPKPV